MRLQSAGPRPRVVLVAAILWVVTAVVMFGIAALFALFASEQVAGLGARDVLDDGGAGYSDEGASIIAYGRAVVAALLGLVVLVFGLLMARRSRYARTTVSVAGAVSAALLLPLPFVVLALVLQFRPAANRWFRADVP